MKRGVPGIEKLSNEEGPSSSLELRAQGQSVIQC